VFDIYLEYLLNNNIIFIIKLDPSLFLNFYHSDSQNEQNTFQDDDASYYLEEKYFVYKSPIDPDSLAPKDKEYIDRLENTIQWMRGLYAKEKYHELLNAFEELFHRNEGQS